MILEDLQYRYESLKPRLSMAVSYTHLDVYKRQIAHRQRIVEIRD